jgi:hypothetical protein
MPFNKDHFVTLGGNPDKWFAEMSGLGLGQDLCALQESQSERGYRPAELVKSMYGWSVRYASGLQGFSLLLSGRKMGRKFSREEAIAWGKAWAAEDPDNREFYARRADLEGADEFAA